MERAERGLDQGAGLLLILTALPHGHANAAGASGLPSSVCCVQFIQLRGEEWKCLLCESAVAKDIKASLFLFRLKPRLDS